MGGLVDLKASKLPEMPEDTPEETGEEEKQQRLEDIQRRRRGRAGTVRTSWAGVMRPNSDATGKERMGE